MCDTSSITVGTIVMVKVGRNETEVVVTEIGENRWKVKKVGSDREFAVSKIERVLGESTFVQGTEPVEPEIPSEPESATVMEEESETSNPAPESCRVAKKLSLLEAADDAGNTAVPTESEIPAEPENMPNPAPESCRVAKKLSLLDAAAEALKHSRRPMNTKEIIARIIESGLWMPTGAKTPEQSLYSAIFREIKEKETPRFRKSAEKKGSFEYNR